ncbi:unnamed protein product [Gongylonema pulchrum]|uniref:Ig-like domain-containing protein n=1 Tax=Gongylonema pulchrum TaxID=637853 RepID=A0A183EV36_9BILA|nr:unnamed protein product [Gongylonema pulchrum]
MVRSFRSVDVEVQRDSDGSKVIASVSFFKKSIKMEQMSGGAVCDPRTPVRAVLAPRQIVPRQQTPYKYWRKQEVQGPEHPVMVRSFRSVDVEVQRDSDGSKVIASVSFFKKSIKMEQMSGGAMCDPRTPVRAVLAPRQIVPRQQTPYKVNVATLPIAKTPTRAGEQLRY